MEKQWKQWQTLFFWAPKSLQMVTATMKLKDACSLGKKLWPTQTAYEKAKTLLCQQRSIQSKLWFSQCHVWMWELDYKKSWAPKNWCFWTVGWRLLRVPWTARRYNQSTLNIHWKDCCFNWSCKGLRKDPDAGKDWRQKEKGTIEDEMVGWYHQLNGHESEQAPDYGEGCRSLTCCSPWSCRVRLNDWTAMNSEI